MDAFQTGGSSPPDYTPEEWAAIRKSRSSSTRQKARKSSQEPSESRVAIPTRGRARPSVSAPDILATSKTLFRHGRAFHPGRPRVSTSEQKRKARERTRAYRKRRA